MSTLSTPDAIAPTAMAPLVWLPAWAVAMLGALVVTAGAVYFVLRARRARAARRPSQARGRRS